MDIRNVLRDFKEYDITYNYITKVLRINKPMKVNVFMALRMKLRDVREEIKDIIIEV